MTPANRFCTRLTTAPMLFTVFIAALLALSACAVKKPDSSTRLAQIDLSLLQTLPMEKIPYEDEVRPVLQRRWVFCHGCFDAPCQLKLSSPEGIKRGASKEKVYNGARFTAQSPTRLYLDAKTPGDWRGKGFHSVLNEGTADAEQNLDRSVLYKMLHPAAPQIERWASITFRTQSTSMMSIASRKVSHRSRRSTISNVSSADTAHAGQTLVSGIPQTGFMTNTGGKNRFKRGSST